jgi:hypothetical protein
MPLQRIQEDEEEEPESLSADIIPDEVRIPVELLTPFEDTSTDSFEQLFGTPIKNPSNDILNLDVGIPLLKTPKSQLNEFLFALEKGGYVSHPSSTRHHEFDSPSSTSASPKRFFFSSALAGVNGTPDRTSRQVSASYPTGIDDENDPILGLIPRQKPSTADQEHMIAKLNSLINMNEDGSGGRGGGDDGGFTAESLKRNWDMDDEYENDEEFDEKLGTISKVIEEKKKHSLNNLYSAYDEDITHYEGSLMSPGTNSGDASEANSGRNTAIERMTSSEDLENKKTKKEEEENDKEQLDRSQSVEEEEAEDAERVSRVLSKSFSDITPTAKSSALRPTATSSTTGNKDTTTTETTTKDPRLNGDFIIWSSGKMLNADYTSEIYVGLYENEITHYIDSGKLILLNKLSSKLTLAVASSASSNANTNPSNPLLHHSQNNNSTNPILSQQSFHEFTENILSQTATTFDPNNPRGFYPIHVMECVIRPDTELKFFMSLIIKLSKKFNYKCNPLQRSHMIITPTTKRGSIQKLSSFLSSTLHSSQENQSQNNSNSSSSTAVQLEFDQIDVQIVISRELRQRVLLIQFLKRVPFLNNNTFGSMIFSQIAGPYEYIPLSRCPKTRKFMSSVKVKETVLCFCLVISLIF